MPQQQAAYTFGEYVTKARNNKGEKYRAVFRAVLYRRPPRQSLVIVRAFAPDIFGKPCMEVSVREDDLKLWGDFTKLCDSLLEEKGFEPAGDGWSYSFHKLGSTTELSLI